MHHGLYEKKMVANVKNIKGRGEVTYSRNLGNIQFIEHTKNYFHITSTTASNLNKFKNYMIFCHFKLPSAPTQDKFLDFLQHDFSKLNLLQNAFFI